MTRELLRNLVLGLLLGQASPAAAEPVVFIDQVFADADWEIASAGVSPVSSYSFGQDTTAGLGNPTPYQRFTLTNPVDPLGDASTFVILNLRRLGWTYDPSVSGAIDHIDLAQDRIVFDILVGGSSVSSLAVGHLFRLYQSGRSYYRRRPDPRRAGRGRGW